VRARPSQAVGGGAEARSPFLLIGRDDNFARSIERDYPYADRTCVHFSNRSENKKAGRNEPAGRGVTTAKALSAPAVRNVAWER
jgi:hypothetical protein